MKKCCDTCIRMLGLVNMTPGLEFQGHADCGGNDTVSKLFTECLETVIFFICNEEHVGWRLVSPDAKKMTMTMPALLAIRCNGQVRSGPVETFWSRTLLGLHMNENFGYSWYFGYLMLIMLMMLIMMTPMVIMMMTIIRPMIASLAAPERWKPPITAWILNMANFENK